MSTDRELDAALLSVLVKRLDGLLSSRFEAAAVRMADGPESLAYARRNASTFLYHSKEILLSRVAGHSVNVTVTMADRRVLPVTYLNTTVRMWSNGKDTGFSSWISFLENVLTRVVKSLEVNVNFSISKRAGFQILNSMVGDEAMYALKSSIESSIDRARSECVRDRKVEEAMEAFVAKEKASQMKKLDAFIRTNLSLDVLDESDLLDAWRRRAIAEVTAE